MRIDATRPLLARAGPIAPVIIIRMTPARPTPMGDLDRARGLDQIAAPTTHIRHGQTRANPQAIVNATTKMFREVTENMPANDRT